MMLLGIVFVCLTTNPARFAGYRSVGLFLTMSFGGRLTW